MDSIFTRYTMILAWGDSAALQRAASPAWIRMSPDPMPRHLSRRTFLQAIGMTGWSMALGGLAALVATTGYG